MPMSCFFSLTGLVVEKQKQPIDAYHIVSYCQYLCIFLFTDVPMLQILVGFCSLLFWFDVLTDKVGQNAIN
jgi:hypothetical protein